ncbi:hypothetical protein P5V15_004289 [Pogonomyrmex californicus]
MFAKIKLGRFNLELPIFVANIGEDCILDADFFSRVGMQTVIESFLRGDQREDFCRRIKQEDEAMPAELEEFFDNNSRELEVDQRIVFATLLREFRDMFSEQAVAGKCEVLQHKIELMDSRPIKQVPKRIPIHMRSEVERIMEDMKEQEVIEESSSP